jgi:hypothetical protein
MKTARVAATILLLSSGALSQARVSLAGGVNMSGAVQSNFFAVQPSSTTGFVLGGTLECPITEHLSIVVNPTYVEKGGTARLFEARDVVPRVSINLSYLDLPLMLKYSIGKDLKPYLVLGPSLGINLSSSVGLEIKGPGFGNLEVVAANSNIVRDIECSVHVGAGLSYQIDDLVEVFAEARYVASVTNAFRHSGIVLSMADVSVAAGVQDNSVYRNKGILLLCGFSLPL